MTYRLLSALGVLLGIAPGVAWLISERRVCLGSPFLFELEDSVRSTYIKLYFLRNRRERIIATGTESLDPQYPFKDNGPYIPEVTERHEGEYYWAVNNVRSKYKHIRLILKDCSTHKYLDYGEELKLDVPRDASVLEFTPFDSVSRWVLWSRINAKNERGARGMVALGQWRADRMTPADVGSYILRRESGGQISHTVVKVQAKTEIVEVADVENWNTFVHIPTHEVVVSYITPAADQSYTIFQNGLETDKGFSLFRDRIRLDNSWAGRTKFGIWKVQPSDAGLFEIRDKKGHLAMSMDLVRGEEFDWSSLIMPLGTTAGVIAGLVCCCWCCCKVCSDSDDSDNAASTAVSPDTEPPVHFHVPPSTLNPWESSPPPYVPDLVPSPVIPVAPFKALDEGSGGGALGGAGAGGGDIVAPSAPLDPGLRYQPRAWGSGLDDFLSSSPLCLDTTAADSSTYTSAKLNF
ncbi:uncharacterized protein LOC134095252 isoform X2 [Sardina pilchardus]|uniref:uncharacterized protein LOC134095252 isoform X2 n=1 Tax=Sardina pilchardus TaxID=27697 RepID=UPI002E12D5C7